MYWDPLSIQPDRGIVRMYIRSNSISIKPGVPNTLTLQYSGTNYATWYYILIPVLSEVKFDCFQVVIWGGSSIPHEDIIMLFF